MNKILLSVALIVFAQVAIAKQERVANDVCETRVPSLGLRQAIDLVTQQYKDKEIFVDEAKLQCSDNALYWLIGFRLKAYESGHSFVKVLMDGSIENENLVKDG